MASYALGTAAVWTAWQANLSIPSVLSAGAAPSALRGNPISIFAIATLQTYNWAGLNSAYSLLSHSWAAFSTVTGWVGKAAGWVQSWESQTLNVAAGLATTAILYTLYEHGTSLFKVSGPTPPPEEETTDKVSSFFKHISEHSPLFFKHLKNASFSRPLQWLFDFYQEYLSIQNLKKPTLPPLIDILYTKNLPHISNQALALWEQFTKPLGELAQDAQARIEESISPLLRAKQAIVHFSKLANIHPRRIGQVGSMLSTAEATLNWAGKVPYISHISGNLRSMMGLSIGAIATVAGGIMWGVGLATNDRERMKQSISLVREFAGRHGLTNFVRGIGEAYAYEATLLPFTLWDLSGYRSSYIGEKPSALHITPVLARAL